MPLPAGNPADASPASRQNHSAARSRCAENVFSQAWELEALYKSIEIREQFDDTCSEPVVGVRFVLSGSTETKIFYDLETGQHQAVASYLVGDGNINMMVRAEYLLEAFDYLVVGGRLFCRGAKKK